MCKQPGDKVLALALPDQVDVLDLVVASLIQFDIRFSNGFVYCNNLETWNCRMIKIVTLQNVLALRTSSASFAMKNPTVLALIFTPRGLISIFVSIAPSGPLRECCKEI